MSVLNQSGEEQVTGSEQVECPLCMEPLEVDDLHFYPCTCGYQICRFCWNRIREIENGLCPACRKAYPENPADFTPLSQEQVAAIKTEKKAREQKRRNKTLESRRALANVRVVQNNLVFVVGLPVRLADPEILKRQEYFGKYGKIHKVVINQSNTYAGSQGPSASAYVTYVSGSDALRAIQGVNNVALDGRVLKGSLGTTKYCANFMKNTPCPKPDCMYLHDLGDPKASFTKEEMHAGLHQVYERKLHQALLTAAPERPAGNATTNGEKPSSKEGNPSNFIPTTVVTSSHINVVNSSRSKKDSVNGNSNGSSIGNGNSNGSSSSSSSSSSSKDAWPSLGSSPPSDAPSSSPPPAPASVKSQEQNGQSTSESSSPTQQPQPKQSTDQPKRKEKKNSQKSKENKKAASINNIEVEDKPTSTVFESQNFTNDLDELESDRHNLLETHDLLDSDHSLLEDDSHSLLNEVNHEVFSRQREFPAGAPSAPAGYERTMLARPYLPPHSIAIDSANELLGANYHPNHNILPPFGMRVDNSLGSGMASNMANSMASNMGNSMANNMVNGMANNMVNSMANSMANHMGVNSITSSLGNPMGSHMAGNTLSMGNTLGNMNINMNSSLNMPPNMGGNTLNMSNHMANTLGMNNMNSMQNMQNTMSPFMMHNQPMMQSQLQHQMVNGFDGPQNQPEGRYLAENMDKFFTDFRQAQQMRLLLGRERQGGPGGQGSQMGGHGQQGGHGGPGGHSQQGHGGPMGSRMLSAHRLEMEHKQGPGRARAAGDADDDLDFDPFKETQKALAEMMETEMMQGSMHNGESERLSRLVPPGFAPPAAPYRHHVPQHHQALPPGFPSHTAAVYSDWTAMDPAIVSAAAGAGAAAAPKELRARLQQIQINNNKLAGMGGMGGSALWAGGLGAGGAAAGGKLWGGSRVPLPPGFAPPSECIDAK